MMLPKAYRLLIIAALLLTLPACADVFTYSADPIEARVIDAETKQPLAGVVVVAHWQLERGTVGGNVLAGQLVVMEAVTDEQGRFSFAAWGPKRAYDAVLIAEDPQLIFFKSGYEYRILSNTYTTQREQRLRERRYSEWNGKTIVLNPYDKTSQAYATYLGGSFRPALRFVFEDDHWKSTPCLLLALDHKARELGYNNVTKLMSVPNLMREEAITRFMKGEAACEKP